MGNKYQLKNRGEATAILWRGKAEDLVKLPDFNKLVTEISCIDWQNSIEFNWDGLNDIKAIVDKHYIVHDHDGFYILEKKEFEQRFEPVVEAISASDCLELGTERK